MTDLNGKTALVTGGSRGIGAAIARRLAADGARLIVHYGASRDAAEAVAAEIRAAGGQADIVAADLAAPDGAAMLVAGVKALGIDRIDILAANAGVATMATLEQQTIEDFDRQFAVNVRAPFFLIQQAAPLLATGGSIILTSSVVARIAFPEAPAYAATKGALETLVRSFAAGLGPRGIRVNAVAPGAIETEMNPYVGTEEGRDFIFGLQTLKRVGQVDDIADVVGFLAGDQSRWMTGRVLEASGGMSLV